ncbi:hypothetical protein Noda2021_05650 [Candidatus Dependentiae bacterium Noda2021]|nr:hypothetical protein Noda2021_05650 [Candidatus Dependentiae bacterium Noda2021]
METITNSQIATASHALNFLGNMCAKTHLNPGTSFLSNLPEELQFQEIVKHVIELSKTQKEARYCVVSYLSICKINADYLKKNNATIKSEINKKDKDVWLTKPIAKNSLTTYLYKEIGIKTWQR